MWQMFSGDAFGGLQAIVRAVILSGVYQLESGLMLRIIDSPEPPALYREPLVGSCWPGP